MRITHQMMTRNYLKQMNTNLTNLTGSNEKLTSQRAFNKAHEDVSGAGKALKIRKLIADNERNYSAIKEAQSRAKSAEDGIRNVNALLIAAEDRMVEGLNGTLSQTDRDKIATELSKLQEEVLQIMNGQFSDKYLYNASGNAEGTAPFTVDEGVLMYHGKAVDTMEKSPDTGRPATLQADGSYADVPWNAHNYVDIGAGYDVKASGAVDANTAFRDTFSGVESFGYGKNADGVPLNAWSLLGSMVTHLRAGNEEAMGKDLNAIHDSMEFLLTSITEVGARYSMLDDAADRMENEYVNLADTQNRLEGVDVSKEIIYNKDFEMSWLVTLQLGSRILPQTIFDFIR